MSSCPSPDTISQFANDQLSVPRVAAMEAHVETCSACQHILERLTAQSFECPTHDPKSILLPEKPPTIPGFVIERELGRGGMGVVYQAWQPQLDRRVAIKVVNASVGTGAEDRRRWLREAQAIGRVRHHNIVRLHEAGEHDGCLYLVLDLITGGSLAERLTGPLPARVAVKLMLPVAHAVEHVHKAGMLHLDIKPSNILLDGPADGPWEHLTPMLADFGIARASDDPRATTTALVGLRGTPSFMAPEQVAGHRSLIGQRSDVYALGASLYSLLTGRPPFQAASVIETLDILRTRDPAPPRTLIPGLPRDLETIAMTCLRKDPRRRYATAGALADDLSRWLHGFPIRARPVSKLEHTTRWCRRRPAFASLLAVLAITVASSLVGLLTLWRRAEAERARAETALILAVASDKATSRTVRDLIGLLTSTAQAPQTLAYERLVETSRVVRDLTAKLRHDRGLAAPNVVAICTLERDLAEDFSRRAKYAESNKLLTDALELLQGQTSDARHPDVVEAHARTVLQLASNARVQEKQDEMLALLERAEEILKDSASDPQNVQLITAIDDTRRAMVWLFERRGQHETRRTLLESHAHTLERISEQAGSDPVIGLLAALTRATLVPGDHATATVRAAMQRLPVDQELAPSLADKVGIWIATDIQPYPPRPKPPAKPLPRLAPDDHARTLILALDSRCEAAGGHPAILPAAAVRVGSFAYDRCMQERNSGQMDDARWTTASFVAFGKSLARRNPNEAVFHVVLCEAFEQEAKNAWKINDFATIEAATRNALVEASTALRLDRRNPLARMKLAGLQEKIVGLTSRRPPPH